MAKSADRYFGLDAFKIIERGFDPAHALESESIFSLSNEHMGVRGYFEEGGGASLRGSYLGGVYEAAPYRPDSAYKGFISRTHYMVTAADCLETRLAAMGEALDLTKCSFRDFSRVLDLRSGLLRRAFLWENAFAGRIEIVFERLLGMESPELLGQRITLTALDRDVPVTLMLGVNGNIRHQSTGECLWEEASKREGEMTLHTKTSGMAVRYTLATHAPSEATRACGYRSLSNEYAFTLAKGVQTEVTRVVSVCVARDGEALTQAPVMKSFDTLLEENKQHWGAFWRDSDVVIKGDPENQQGIRYCLFQLHSAYRGLDPRDNIGAKGLTGEAYNGHAFWDTETYCLPFYLLCDPVAARRLIEYRYHTLSGARERAKQLDLKGACYPVATMDGTEACALWQHSSLQMQPSTAVSYAIESYFRLTGDTDFLYHQGAEMLCEIARYVLSRGGWNENGFGFYGVMGPDEFHMMVSNDFYTNFMGKKALLFAAETLEKMDKADRAQLAAKIGLAPDEKDEWRRAAEGMILLRRDDGVYEQHEGYFSLPHLDVNAIPLTEFPLYEHWSYDRIYRTDMLKQPDVLMAMLLYPADFTREEMERNYAFYEPRCIHESSLSPSVHAILSCWLGRKQEALRFFGFATRLDLDNYNRNTREGLHLSSVAAAWVTIVEGFGGVRTDGGRLRLAPWLPAGWEELAFSLRIGGSLVRVQALRQELTLWCEGEPIAAECYGQPVVIGQTPLKLPVGKEDEHA